MRSITYCMTGLGTQTLDRIHHAKEIGSVWRRGGSIMYCRCRLDQGITLKLNHRLWAFEADRERAQGHDREYAVSTRDNSQAVICGVATCALHSGVKAVWLSVSSTNCKVRWAQEECDEIPLLGGCTVYRYMHEKSKNVKKKGTSKG